MINFGCQKMQEKKKCRDLIKSIIQKWWLYVATIEKQMEQNTLVFLKLISGCVGRQSS